MKNIYQYCYLLLPTLRHSQRVSPKIRRLFTKTKPIAYRLPHYPQPIQLKIPPTKPVNTTTNNETYLVLDITTGKVVEVNVRDYIIVQSVLKCPPHFMKRL